MHFQTASKRPLGCKISWAVSVNCPRSSNSNLPIFPLALSFCLSPPFQGTVVAISLPMPLGRSALTAPDVHLLRLSTRLLGILGEELAIIIIVSLFGQWGASAGPPLLRKKSMLLAEQNLDVLLIAWHFGSYRAKAGVSDLIEFPRFGYNCQRLDRRCIWL